jgi:hypothetical protein
VGMFVDICAVTRGSNAVVISVRLWLPCLGIDMSVKKFDQFMRWLFAPNDEYAGGVCTCCACESYIVKTDLFACLLKVRPARAYMWS